MANTDDHGFDLANWRTSPHNESAFINIDKIINTQRIEKSSKSAASFAKSASNLDGFSAKLGDKVVDLPTLLEQSNTDGFMVLHKSKVVHDFFAHGNDANSKHIIMSMTKSVTSLVVGVLVEQGILDVESKVVQYLPEVNGTPYEHVSIRHLLDMRSGIQYKDASHEYRYCTGWNPAREGEEPTDFLEFLSNFHPPSNAPGGDFEYLSVNTDVLGLVIERASGKKLSALIHEHVWEPIGAESDALITVDAKGNPRAAGGMCATVSDLARLGQALISGHIIPKSWLNDTLTGGDPELIARGSWAAMTALISPNIAYRNCWLADGEAGLMIAMGIHGQTLVVDHKNDIVMVKTSSQPDGDSKIASALVAFKEIQRVLLR
jgi:CubicO group peptidase (beta-lactamase class C family)